MANREREPTPVPLNVIGLHMTPLVEAPAAGEYEVFLQEGAEGVGPGPHSHPWDETFYMLSGQVSFGLGDVTSVAYAGDSVHVPAKTVHWFTLGQGGARMLSVSGGHNHSRLFREMDAASIDPTDQSSENVAGMLEMATRHGVTLNFLQ